MSFISTATMQFAYFDALLPGMDWSNKKVLDFGGNIGNILTNPNCTITHENYWCLDVSRDAIVMGQYKWPNAHFVFYDCYNFSFNPGGISDLPIPDLKEQFDIILSYSIFTHTGIKEMRDKVRALQKMLKPEGQLLFTYIDPDYNPFHINPDYRNINNFELRIKRLNNGILNPELVARNRNATWSILLNRDDLYVEDEDHRHYNLENRDTYFSFFRSSFMQKNFPGAQLMPPPLIAFPRDYPAELQHACLLHKIDE